LNLRASLIISAVTLPAMLLVLGIAFFVVPPDEVSEVEARKLAPWPEFDFRALREGKYTREIELFVADHFPEREAFVSFTFALRARMGVRAETTVYASSGGALGGFDAPLAPERVVTSSPDASVEVDPFLDESAPLPDPLPQGGEGALVDEPVVVASTVEGGVLISEHRGMMLLSATDDTARAFAKVLNTYGARLKDVNVYALVVPGAGAFYLPAAERHRNADELQNLAAMRDALEPEVTWVDVAAALKPHVGESLYYRSDHHWTGLGAYYGYRALCEVAGLEPIAQETLAWRTGKKSTLGSLYRMTRDEGLKTPEATQYVMPSGPYVSVSYVGAAYDVPEKRRFIDESEAGYLVFLGGDAPLIAAKTKLNNGRRVLLVKNSFGNALAPWLLAHFEQVVVVDYRLYFGTIEKLVKRFHITDVVLQNATLTANDPYHRGRMRMVLSTPYRPKE
jgi:DHHW protein